MKVFAIALLFFQAATGLASSPDAATTAELDPSEVEPESSPSNESISAAVSVEDLDVMEDMIEGFGSSSMKSMSYNYYVGGHTEYGQTGQIEMSPREQCAIYQKAELNFIQVIGGALKGGSVQLNFDPFCLPACGLMRVCPDTCPTKEDIANFCDRFEDVTSFDPNCPYCPDTCRISCISWVSSCCNCAPATELVLLDAAKIVNSQSIGGYNGRRTVSNLDPSFLDAAFFEWIHNAASPNAVRFAIEKKKGVGLEFLSDISKYYYTQASLLALFVSRNGNWVHNEDPNISEDGVVFKGVETEKGQVYPKMDAEFRLIFIDSMGCHISAEPYKLNQKLKIQAADPNLKYNRLELFPDNENTLAGTILGPSQPSFKCIGRIGFMITAGAKRYFTDRNLFEEDADVLSSQEEEVAETQGLNPYGYYTAFVEEFFVEAKGSSILYTPGTVKSPLF